MYIIQKVESDLGKPIINVEENLDDIDMAVKTPLSQLAADLSEIRKNSKHVEKALKSQVPPPQVDLVTEKLQTFYAICIDTISEFDNNLKQLEQKFE